MAKKLKERPVKAATPKDSGNVGAGSSATPKGSREVGAGSSATTKGLRDVGAGNAELMALNLRRRLDFRRNPELFYPWRRRCAVKVLLVTDGGLDFGEGDFGLATLVRILRDDAPTRVRFDLTLAHLRNVTDPQMLDGEAGVVRRIKNFRFDDASHFAPDMYDQVWLFGIETSYASDAGRGEFLAPAETQAIHAHMQRGGGVFATGDHGLLGRALGGGVPRVRGMRHWEDFPANAESEVSMTGPLRNDTNQLGHDAGSQFSDQSDDVPQPLDLLLYSTRIGALRAARYPHPVLCGRAGRIDVFPDHPHEGECRVPPDLTQSFGGAPEYPTDAGGTQILPEVIARSHVPAGNNARGTKDGTVAHTFGAVSAYDGHRAGGKGRVVCDATWHHFINVNLIGILEGGGFDEFVNPGEDPGKHDGFLSSAAGLVILERIKNYYTNIGVWISPPARHACFNRVVWWDLVFADRIMEAALISPDVPLERIPASTLMYIGTHARDAFGRRASQCQTIEWLIDWIKDLKLIEVAWIDPWDPVTRLRVEEAADAPLPILDPMPLVDVALGAALVSMRQAFPYPPEKPGERHDAIAMKAVQAGASYGIKLAKKLAIGESGAFAAALR
jgi:hypothetical protein